MTLRRRGWARVGTLQLAPFEAWKLKTLTVNKQDPKPQGKMETVRVVGA